MTTEICVHERVLTELKSCEDCGCYYNSRNNVQGLKSERYRDWHSTIPVSFLKSLIGRLNNFQQMEPVKMNPVINQILEQLVSKFNFSLTTFARAMYMFHRILKEKPQLQYQQLRYGAVCLYLSVKMTEAQDDIPSLSKFIRQACKVFERAEYVALQEEVFAFFQDKIFEVGFFPQMLDYYLVKGVVFNTERINVPVTDIQKKIRETAFGYIASGEFLNVKQQNLAAFVLYQARQELKVSEIWNEHVEYYSQVGTYEVYNIVKELRRGLTKPTSIESKKLILKHHISSVTSTTISFAGSSNLSRNVSLVDITTPKNTTSRVVNLSSISNMTTQPRYVYV